MIGMFFGSTVGRVRKGVGGGEGRGRKGVGLG